jgi:hypothetical protein
VADVLPLPNCAHRSDSLGHGKRPSLPSRR